MKHITFIVIIVTAFGCSYHTDTLSRGGGISREDLDGLSVAHLATFWQGLEPKIRETDPSGVLLSSREGYICGKQWEWVKPHGDEKSRRIGISVFETQAAAVAAMKFRLRNIASVTVEGADEGTFSGRWWRGVSSAFITVNHRNCIIEVALLSGKYDEHATLLKETATKVISQIDTLKGCEQ